MFEAIIARKSPLDLAPIVFIVDSYNRENNSIDAWTPEKGFMPTTVSFYNSTLPLSNSDEKEMARIFAHAVKQSEISLRFRLPRQSKVRENILAVQNIVAPVAEQSVIVPEPASIVPNVSPQEKPRAEKVQETSQKPLSATFTRRKYDRKPRAQKAPVEAVKASQATPQIDIAAALAGMQAKMDNEIQFLLRIIRDNGFDVDMAQRGMDQAEEVHVKH